VAKKAGRFEQIEFIFRYVENTGSLLCYCQVQNAQTQISDVGNANGSFPKPRLMGSMTVGPDYLQHHAVDISKYVNDTELVVCETSVASLPDVSRWKQFWALQ